MQIWHIRWTPCHLRIHTEKDSLKHKKSRAKFVSLSSSPKPFSIVVTVAIAQQICYSLYLSRVSWDHNNNTSFHNAVIRILSFFLETQFFHILVSCSLFLNPKKSKILFASSTWWHRFYCFSPGNACNRGIEVPGRKSFVFSRELLRENVNICCRKWVICQIRKCLETRLKFLPFLCKNCRGDLCNYVHIDEDFLRLSFSFFL